MRIKVSQLRELLKEALDSSVRSAMNRQADYESEATYASGKRGTKRGDDDVSARYEKKNLAKARRRTGKAISRAALSDMSEIDESDHPDWAPGDVARVGIDDESFFIDPTREQEWNLVPGAPSSDNKAYSLNPDETSVYELPMGSGIEDFSDPYDDDFDYIDKAQRAGSIQNEARYEDYSVLDAGTWLSTIVMSPNGDSVLIGGEETYPESAPDEVERLASEALGFRVPPMPQHTQNQLVQRLYDGMRDYFVEIAVEYNANTGWKVS